MNITFIDSQGWGNPRLVGCLADGLHLGDFILGVDPPADAVAQACARPNLKSYVFPWLEAARLLFCVPRGMTVLPPDKWLSGSRDSAAVYPAYWDLAPSRRGGILLQILDGRGSIDEFVYTSIHQHWETVERFYLICGTAQIQSATKPGWRSLAWQEEIPLCAWHQLRVPAGSFAITFIKMDGPYPVVQRREGELAVNLADHHHTCAW
jgi:hypothetical protein